VCRQAGRTSARVIGSQTRIWREEVGLADITQNRGEEDVSDREVGACDPVATFQPALEFIKPAVGLLDNFRSALLGIPS
jgi:hypothetical protein